MTQLTRKQHQVLVAYVIQPNMKAVADLLGMRERNVKNHLDVVRRKMGAQAVWELPLRAIAEGIVSIEARQDYEYAPSRGRVAA